MNSSHIFNKIQFIVYLLLIYCSAAHASHINLPNTANVHSLSHKLEVGDIVFIQVTPYPFQKVASTTHSWVNHVGIVVNTSGDYPIIAESTFPYSKMTTLDKFIKRSNNGRVAVSRLDKGLSGEEKERVISASNKRLGIFYDTGFNLHSNREFCSRFVSEVINESTGISVGRIETFKTILDNTPAEDVAFWRIWYLGNIPWSRETITPASLYKSANLKTIFYGFAN